MLFANRAAQLYERVDDALTVLVDDPGHVTLHIVLRDLRPTRDEVTALVDAIMREGFYCYRTHGGLVILSYHSNESSNVRYARSRNK